MMLNKYVSEYADHPVKILARLFWLTIFMFCAQLVQAAQWDNLNQFEPNKMASEDIINGMYVCINNSEGKVFGKLPEKRFQYCSCIMESMRSSTSMADFKNKSGVGKRCIIEVNSNQGLNSSPELFMNTSEIYNYGLTCSDNMKKKNPYSSLGYRSIACGCILDFIQKEKNLNPSKSDKRFCYEYAKKQYPDDSEGVLKKNRIIFLLILIGLPILIFIDSKIRLGRFSWGWAFMSLIITIGTMVAVANIFKSLKGLEQGQIISILIGSIVGAYVGGFTLYRAMSRRREKKDSGQAKS